MITYKHITKIVIVIVAAALLCCLGSLLYAERLTELTGGKAVFMEYESRLFDRDQIISLDIQIDESDWEALLSHAIEENYYECGVTVNGTVFSNVGIRPKGNTSLTSIANDPDTDRYSLKLEFDHYVDGQTCFGLDKLILNNNYADASNMKEAVVYDMYQYLEADASLYNYAKVSVNGEYWGVYLALEAVEESFMLRNYGVETGKLYKPEGMGGRKHMPDLESDDVLEMPDFPDKETGNGMEFPEGEAGSRPEFPEGEAGRRPELPDEEAGNRPEFSDREIGNDMEIPDEEAGNSPEFSDRETGNGMEFSDEEAGNRPEFPDREAGNRPDFSDRENGNALFMGGGGADLNYIDDEMDSYATIWEGAVTDTAKADHKRVIAALKQIGSGVNLEEYLDVDAVLKYMAVHTFAVNLDSLTGNMPHNYYLYESDGQLNVLPWDYNLAFGGMAMGKNNSASETVNYPIDTPFSGTRFFDALLKDETYLAAYHKHLRQLTEEYVQNKRFDAVYTKIRTQIDDLVRTDPTAFYTYDEYDAGAEMLFETILLRAKSVRGQLNGSVPSTDSQQREHADDLVDASEIDLSVMGEFHGGGMGAGKPDMRTFSETESDASFKMTFGKNKTDSLSFAALIRNGICGIILILAVALTCFYHRKRSV